MALNCTFANMHCTNSCPDLFANDCRTVPCSTHMSVFWGVMVGALAVPYVQARLLVTSMQVACDAAMMLTSFLWVAAHSIRRIQIDRQGPWLCTMQAAHTTHPVWFAVSATTADAGRSSHHAEICRSDMPYYGIVRLTAHCARP